MKKILLATSNKDKYKIVKYLLQKAGLNDEEYQFLSLKDIEQNIPDEKEQGEIEHRARRKAEVVAEKLFCCTNLDFIIGIDDGIELKGTIRPNVKDHVAMILYENYLEENESIIFPRAYYCISKSNKTYSIVARIEYKYKPKENVNIEPNSYPLSQIAVPLNSNKSLTEMSELEGNEYCWECCKNEIIKLANFIKGEN